MAPHYRIPFVDPREHYRRIKGEVDSAISDTLAAGDLVLRRQLTEFERRLADYVGTKYAVGLASGYHALHLALLALSIGPGDEVITAGHTFVASVSAIVHAGASPVLVDVGEDYTMDVDAVAERITERTRAIMPVHLNGRICAMDRLQALAREHRLTIVEDAAQALGARFQDRMAGSFGAAGCFSFYPLKALGGIGDGGALTTDDAEIARTATLLRYNGEDRETGELHAHGYTALLDNVNAAVLDVKLRHLPRWIEHRRALAGRYHAGLSRVGDLGLPSFDETSQVDSFQNYVIRTSQRGALREHLIRQGIEALVHWPKPMWAHKGLGLDDPRLPETERICHEVLSLPMSAELTPEQVDIVTASVREFFTRR
jgi:dTDP-4-amino-4,6-dideoxygalactose transaminase